MAAITIKLNGTPVMTKSAHETQRAALAGVMTTANIGAKTVMTALNALDGIGGARVFAESINAHGNPDDIFEVYENDIKKARGTRVNLAKRILTALDAESWAVEIFTEKKSGEKSADVSQEMEIV